MPVAVEIKKETLEEKKGRAAQAVAYKFRDESELTEEQLTDPDYAKKRLARDFGNGNIDILTCSKCHHCR